MQNPFLDAGQDYFLPFEKITQLQMEAGERLIKSQSNLVSDLYNKGLAYSETVFGKSTLDEVWKTQQAFLSDCGESVRSVAEDNMGVINETSEKIAAIVQGSMPDMPSMRDFKAAADSVAKSTPNAAAAAKKPATRTAKQTTNKASAATKTSTKKTTSSARKATDKTKGKTEEKAEAIASKS